MYRILMVNTQQEQLGSLKLELRRGAVVLAVLSQLKQARFVDSQRGKEGGYFLVRSPENISVGDVIRYVHGSLGPVMCVLAEPEDKKCPLYGDCVFLPMWQEVQAAVSQVYDKTTFHDLVEQDREKQGEYVPCYSI